MDTDMFPERFPVRLAQLGFQGRVRHGVEVILPPVCKVAAGPFLMGSDPTYDRRALGFEQPQYTVTLPAYDIARFPVTVAEYACFVRAGQHEPDEWQAQLGKLDYPVVSVSWYDAVAYAAWLAECSGEVFRLPSEAEWEKAARGTDGRIYPWGDTFDKRRCNTSESGIKATTPIGSYPRGAGPYGAQDMAGNVWEWTTSQFLPYPCTVSGEPEDPDATNDRVLRGGSWDFDAGYARTAYRDLDLPDDSFVNGGFRLVRAAPGHTPSQTAL